MLSAVVEADDDVGCCTIGSTSGATSRTIIDCGGMTRGRQGGLCLGNANVFFVFLYRTDARATHTCFEYHVVK
jgi:hypothetical protein